MVMLFLVFLKTDIMQVITKMQNYRLMAFIVFLMGLLCLFETQALLNTDLGQSICIGLGVFWGLRLLVQFFGYSSKLWRGKIFETSVHIVFILIWGYLTFLFLWIGFVL